MQKYDLIVVGAGPAGLAAGLFASRRGMNTLLLSKHLGGQAATTPDIENYPGLPLMEGWDMMDVFSKQVKKFGGDLRMEEVTAIHKTGDEFTVLTSNHEHTAETVILAFGKTPNDLGVPGETRFKDKQVHYAALRDTAPYKGETVAVIGGANTAAQSAITLADVAKKVYLLAREGELRAEQILIDRLKERGDVIEIIYNVAVKEFVGEEKLQKIKATVGEEQKEFVVNEAFIGIGYSNKTDWVRELVAVDKIGQIIIQPDCSTSTPGLFAAGDVTTIPYKQVVISAGEGAKAAIAAHNYWCKKHGKLAPTIDWGAKK